MAAWISSSQPLHDPASTCRIASERPKCFRITSPIRCSSWRSDSSGCGAGSVMIPVFAICRRSRYMSEILPAVGEVERFVDQREIDRKSTRLNSSHLVISYAVFCLKKKKKQQKNI